jgi:uncharacterized protein (TIGR02145 family)
MFSCSSGNGDDGGGGTSSSSSVTAGGNSSSSVAVGGVSSSSGGGTSSSSSVTAGGVSSSSGGGSSSPSGGKGNDIASYETVKIGNQTWMAENLDYAVDGSTCYDGDPANCAKYGRLYNWTTAMALSSDCNFSICSSLVQEKHRGVCPSGWHIPSNKEWDELFRFADGTNGTSSPYDSPTAGKHLKAKDGWNSCGPSGSGKSYSCEDTYGFAALPGGFGRADGGFSIVGYYGYWWSASELSSNYAYYRNMYYIGEDAYWGNRDKSYLFSVRCAQD